MIRGASFFVFFFLNGTTVQHLTAWALFASLCGAEAILAFLLFCR